MSSRYGLAGWWYDLPPMNHGRWFHGCGHFTNSPGGNVLLVAGGYDGHNTLDSCEILVDNAQRWTSISPLPMPIKYHVGASLYNKVFMTGALGKHEENKFNKLA